MSQVQHRVVETNGLHLRIAEQGSGPLVILCHGFPESWSRPPCGAMAAVIAGHDWGAPVAWHAALLRPDRFPAVIGLSVPFIPRRPVRPTTTMPQTNDAVFYQHYFLELWRWLLANRSDLV